MKYLSILCSVIFVMSCELSKENSESKIVGGKAVTQSYDFFVGLLESPSRKIFCGGSLIAPDVALTAAHCVGSLDNTLQVAVACKIPGK